MNQLNIKVYDGQITPNFNIAEFKCKANGEVIINADAIAHIKRLQKFRNWYGRAMTINSGYRTPEYNKSIGGAPQSQHMLGIASDIALPLQEFKGYTKARQDEFLNNIKKKWIALCNNEGLGGGVGFYDTFFHLDSRKITSTWDLRTK